MIMFSVHDKASNSYIPPFFMETERDAIDGFKHVCNEEKTNYYKYPADFTLVKLGEFDKRSAEFELHSPKIIANASALKEKQ